MATFSTKIPNTNIEIFADHDANEEARIIETISGAILLFGAVGECCLLPLIAFASPRTMSTYRYVLLFITVSEILFDAMLYLTQPTSRFASEGGILLIGPLAHYFEYNGNHLVAICIVSAITLSAALTFAFVYRAHKIHAHLTTQPISGFVRRLLCMAVFPILAVIVVYLQMRLHLNFTVEQVRVVLNKLPDAPKTFTLMGDSDGRAVQSVYVIVAVLVHMTFVIVSSMIESYSFLLNSKQMSTTTKVRHRALLTGLVLQSWVPLALVVIPLLVLFIGMYIPFINQFNTFLHLMILIPAFHSTAHGFVLILTVKPYRHFFYYRIWRRESKKEESFPRKMFVTNADFQL